MANLTENIEYLETLLVDDKLQRVKQDELYHHALRKAEQDMSGVDDMKRQLQEILQFLENLLSLDDISQFFKQQIEKDSLAKIKKSTDLMFSKSEKIANLGNTDEDLKDELGNIRFHLQEIKIAMKSVVSEVNSLWLRLVDSQLRHLYDRADTLSGFYDSKTKKHLSVYKEHATSVFAKKSPDKEAINLLKQAQKEKAKIDTQIGQGADNTFNTFISDVLKEEATLENLTEEIWQELKRNKAAKNIKLTMRAV